MLLLFFFVNLGTVLVNFHFVLMVYHQTIFEAWLFFCHSISLLNIKFSRTYMFMLFSNR